MTDKNLNKMLFEQAYNEYAENKIELGFHAGFAWIHDPKHVLFSLSRYKFVSKMLQGCENVLEIGCGDGFCSALVRCEVRNLSLTDCEDINISQINQKQYHEVFLHNFVAESIDRTYDAIYALDVLEHIKQEDEHAFITNSISSLTEQGVMILGMPTIESQPYASIKSKEGHVNCKNKSEFKAVMQHYFHNVFMFSMNDEVVHTGFDGMSHYIYALCVGKKFS